MQRTQTLDERQREVLSTCLGSCRNIAYPSLGAIEELAEYWQKLLPLIEWNSAIPSSERDHLAMLLRGFITIGKSIGGYAKKYRHSATDANPGGVMPFDLTLNYAADASSQGSIMELLKEVGDVKWMLDAADYYVTHPSGTDPTRPNVVMTAQCTADLNHQKLEERLRNRTIDAQGDNERTPIP